MPWFKKNQELPHGGAYKNFPSAPADFVTSKWGSALAEMFKSAVIHAQSRIDWYDTKSSVQQGKAKWLRWLSLLFFSLGTAAPLLMALANKIEKIGDLEVGKWPYAEAGYMLLAVAGAFVVFDQFFQYSASWMRFRLAQARLEVLLTDLRYSWDCELASCGGVITDGTVAAKLVGLLRDFAVGIESTAEAETKEWAAKFSDGLSKFDQNLKAAQGSGGGAAAVPPGGGSGVNAVGVSGAGAGAAVTEPQPPKTVMVRLAVEGADKIDQLVVTVDNTTVALSSDGHAEPPLQVDKEHVIAATGMRNGTKVQASTTLTLGADDDGKPVLLQLA